MSHRGPLAAVVTTVLGATLGGLLVWRVYRTKRKRLPSVQKAADPVEAPPPVETEVAAAAECRCVQPPTTGDKEFKAVECQTTQPPPPPVRIPSEDLLGVKPVMVSSEEEWQQLWPLMQEELSVFPVLGLDCEWVKTKGVRNTVRLFLKWEEDQSTLGDSVRYRELGLFLTSLHAATVTQEQVGVYSLIPSVDARLVSPDLRLCLHIITVEAARVPV